MEIAVANLDKAKSIGDYQKLANDFARIAVGNQKQWLPPYYAAFCNARIGWMHEKSNPERIEAYVAIAAQQIVKARSLVDSTTQKKEMTEIYCVQSMIKRGWVFINPMTYGKEYGTASKMYLEMAKAIEPENPRVLYLDAWEKYNAPKMWGGDKDKAKELLTLALQKLKSQPSDKIYPRWGKTVCDEILTLY
ncbi:MAG TPA: hypothetical protein VK658_26305 [Chryseolinea sp.]|nr:hypothetical protein [Chryseolinea sp.]